MIIVGLTGGIGSGKSTVSEYLREKGCKIIDADEISRAVTGEGGPALEPILIVGVAVVLGFVVLAILMAVFGMVNAIG